MGLFDSVAEKPKSALQELRDQPKKTGIAVVSGASPGDKYRTFAERCKLLELTEEWLRKRIEEYGGSLVTTSTGQAITVNGWNEQMEAGLEGLIKEFEDKAKEIDGAKPKRTRTTKPKAGSTAESLEAIMDWAEAAGVDRTRVFTLYGGEKDLVKLKEKIAEIIKAHTNPKTGEVVLPGSAGTSDALPSSSSIPVRDESVQSGQLVSGDTIGSETISTPSVAEGALSEAKSGSGTNGVRGYEPKGAARDPEVEAMLNEIRRKIGVPIGDVSGATLTKDQVEKLLRERMLLLQELHYITERFNKLRATLESAVGGLDTTYNKALEQYLNANPHPTGNKSINLLYGTLGKRDKAFSIAKDQANEQEFNAWVAKQSEEFKQKYHVREIKYFEWDWDVFKGELVQRFHADGTKPTIPGTVVTPPAKDVFYIGPSIDTVTDKAKKGKAL